MTTTYPHGGSGQIWRDLKGAEGVIEQPTRPDGSPAQPDDVYAPPKPKIRDYLAVIQARLEAVYAAPVSGSLFATEAAGIAAVEDGALFVVADNDAANILRVYQRSGDAAVQVKSFPNPERIEDAVTDSEAARDAARDAETGAETAESGAEISEAAAAVQAANALAAANATGPVSIYSTKALADAATLSEGDIIEVQIDETRNNQRTRYLKETSALAWLLDMDRPQSAVLASRVLDLSGAVDPAAVEAQIAIAAARGIPFVFDADFTISGDIGVTDKVNLIHNPGVTMTMANSPTITHGRPSGQNGAPDAPHANRHCAGLITFLPGSEGSTFQAWGTFNVNYTNAGTIGGQDIQSSAVLVLGTHSITLRGVPSVLDTFNGVTVVDSDYFRQDTPWRVVGAANAALDPESSDHGYAVAWGEDCEEVVDFNGACDDWEFQVIGDRQRQNAIEVNNSTRIRGTFLVRNCNAVHLFDYATGTPSENRWSTRGRTNVTVNRDIQLSGVVRIDGSYDGDALGGGSRTLLDVQHCDVYSVRATVDIDSGHGSGGTIEKVRIYHDRGGPGAKNGTVNIKTNADVNPLINTAHANLYQLDSPSRLDFAHTTNVPLAAGQRAVYLENPSKTRVTVRRSDLGDGAGLETAGSASTDSTIVDAHLATGAEGSVVFGASVGGHWDFQPFLRGATADRPDPNVSKIAAGQAYWDTDKNRIYHASRVGECWSFTDQTLVAAGTDYASGTPVLPGRAWVTGADGTAGISLPDVSCGFELEVFNVDTSSSLQVFGVSGQNGKLVPIPAGKSARIVPFVEAGKWVVNNGG